MDFSTFDPDRASRSDLERARTLLLQRLDAPRDGDDVNRLVDLAQRVSDRLAAVRDADRRRQNLLTGTIVRTATGAPEGPGDDDPASGSTFVRGAVNAWSERGGGKVGVPIATRALFATPDFHTQPDRLPGIVTPTTPRGLLDVLATRPVNTGRVEFVVDSTAGDVGATEVAEGGVKPEGNLALTPVTEDLQTIAVWVQETRQALQDDPSAAQWVEQRLVDAVRRRLARQVLVGDGTGTNLTGLLNRSGIGSYVSPAGEPAAVVLRKTITVAEVSGQRATAYVVSPTTAEALDLDTGTDEHWRGVPPGLSALRVVDPAMPDGQVLAGDLSGGSVSLLVKDGGSVYVSDSHGSTFTSNILTVLAEGRFGLALFRPSAVAVGTITITP